MSAARRLLRRAGHHGRDAGQSAAEFMGALPLVVLAVMAVIQITIAVATIQDTSTAARAAARTISQGTGSAQTSADAAVPAWVRKRMTVTGASRDAGVTIVTEIPLLLPGFNSPTVTRRAWFDPEHGVTPWG